MLDGHIFSVNRRNRSFFYRLGEEEGRILWDHMVFRGNRGGISRRQPQSMKRAILRKLTANGGESGKPKQPKPDKRGSRTSLLALLKSLAHIQQQHPLKIEVVKTSHYLHECRHSTMVVASTKYPPHNTHIM